MARLNVAQLAAATLVSALFAAPAAAERTPSYMQDEAAFAADAAAIKAGALAPMPARGAFDIALDDASKLDGKLLMLGISCRFWKVDNPLSQIVSRTLGAWDRDGALSASPASPAVRFRATSALTTMRCVEVKEMKARCLTRTRIAGDATVLRAGAAPQVSPVSVEVEHQQNVGVCSGLARGTGLSGRAAGIALVEKLSALAGAAD